MSHLNDSDSGDSFTTPPSTPPRDSPPHTPPPTPSTSICPPTPSPHRSVARSRIAPDPHSIKRVKLNNDEEWRSFSFGDSLLPPSIPTPELSPKSPEIYSTPAPFPVPIPLIVETEETSNEDSEFSSSDSSNKNGSSSDFTNGPPPICVVTPASPNPSMKMNHSLSLPNLKKGFSLSVLPMNHNPFSPEVRKKTQQVSLHKKPGQRTTSKYVSEFDEMEKLGSGSFGSVYKCRNRTDGWIYAVKISNRKLKGKSDKQQRLKEVYALAALPGHPNVVRYYAAWEEDFDLFIQTEFCGSGCLTSKLGQSFTERDLCNLLRQVAQGLQHIHSHGLVHLDIKPDNLYITTLGEYKIGDFGLTNPCNETKTFEEGDFRYLPGELLQEPVKDLTRADIFSLGASIYELAIGRPLPDKGKEWRKLREEANTTMSLPPHYSSEFTTLLKSMMQPESSLRPSAEELLKHPLLASKQKLKYSTVKSKNKVLKQELVQEKIRASVLEKNVSQLRDVVKLHQNDQARIAQLEDLLSQFLYYHNNVNINRTTGSDE